jgi:hypothetical protein
MLIFPYFVGSCARDPSPDESGAPLLAVGRLADALDGVSIVLEVQGGLQKFTFIRHFADRTSANPWLLYHL